MKSLCIIASIFVLAGAANADVPDQKDVFTVHTFGGSNSKNYVSNNFVFSALPYYRELPKGSSTPWKKFRHEQRGVIVTSDKRVFYFSTQDPSFLSITDQKNNTHALHLTEAPHKISQVPQRHPAGSALSLTQENVFCVSSTPWNTTEHFKSMWKSSVIEPITPAQLVDSLPEWRRVTADDVPEHAIMSHSNQGPLIVPSSFTEMKNRPLNGAIVLKDGTVLKYFTRSADAVSLNGDYYLHTKKAEQDAAEQPATAGESK
jgi:hypothetical protein